MASGICKYCANEQLNFDFEEYEKLIIGSYWCNDCDCIVEEIQESTEMAEI
jgi:hypothetical protein